MSGSISATTLAYVGAAAAVAGAATTAYSQVQSGNAQAAASKYNSQVASENATIAQQNASLAGAAGEAQVAQETQKTRATVGGIQAAQAANGVDINSGSDVDVRSSASALGELSAINIRSNAARTAYGYQTQSTSDTAQSKLDTFNAGQEQIAGETGAAGSVLGGVSSAGSNFANYLSKNSISPTSGYQNPLGAYTDSSGISWNPVGQ